MTSENDATHGPEIRDKIRVWMDGCFDMMHFGHANAMRQAKQMGETLVVGVITDAKIAEHKGPTLFTEEERYKMVEAIKWVDEVVMVDEYGTTLEMLDMYNIDFCVHGDLLLDDETTTVDGQDPFAMLTRANKYRKCRYTEGVSTTGLIERILMTYRGKQCLNSSSDCKPLADTHSTVQRPSLSQDSEFYMSSKLISDFAGKTEPRPSDRVVYAAGAFDMFHPGHLDFLKKAAELGDYLILGLYSDSTIQVYKGTKSPIMNLYERTLNVLAFKSVMEVVIDAPYTVTESFLNRFKIDVVCHGQTPIILDSNGNDPYDIPKRLGKFVQVNSGNALRTSIVLDRVKQHRCKYCSEAYSTPEEVVQHCATSRMCKPSPRKEYAARNYAKEVKKMKVSKILKANGSG